MKHVVIVAHPDPQSFTLAVARTYCEALSECGHEPILRDLYRMEFDPRLQACERPDIEGFKPGLAIETEHALLAEASVFAFVYPLWFNAPPAMMKGYMERVFGTSFGHAILSEADPAPRYGGREMISFTSSGSRKAWLDEQGVWTAMTTLYDNYFARVCGLRMREHVHFDCVTPSLEPHWVEQHLETVRAKVRAICEIG